MRDTKKIIENDGFEKFVYKYDMLNSKYLNAFAYIFFKKLVLFLCLFIRHICEFYVHNFTDKFNIIS